MARDKSILNCTTLDELRAISWQDYANKTLTEPEFRHIFSLADAMWLHTGDPKMPHAELTTGLCSNGFIDTLRALRFTNVCQLLAHQSFEKIKEKYDGPVDWVVGSDHAGATFSFAVATFFNAQHDFTVKTSENKQAWKRFAIQPKEVILQVEELMTTSYTMQAVRDGLREGNKDNLTFAPLVFTLIHRSTIEKIEATPVHYLFHFDIWTADPKDCQLCAQGSKRLRPKQNWAELTGKK